MPPRRSSSTLPSPARRRYIGWHNDSASRRSRSSEALVLAWLTTPGNYARWQALHRTQQRDGTAAESRSTLCSEVNALLHSSGIQHRKDRDIYHKIQAMEKSFLAAKKWLQETGLMPSFLQGGTSTEVNAHIAHLCKHYKELEPAFTATQNGTSSEDVVDITQRSSDEEVEDEDEEKRAGDTQEREDEVPSEGQQKETAVSDKDAEDTQTQNEGTCLEVPEREHEDPGHLSGMNDEVSVDDLIPADQLSDNEETPAESHEGSNGGKDGGSKAQREDEEEEDTEATDTSSMAKPARKKLFGKRSAGGKDAEERSKKRSSLRLSLPTAKSPLSAESPVCPLLTPTASPARTKVVKYAEAKPSIAPKRKTSDVSSAASLASKISENAKESAAAKRTKKPKQQHQSPGEGLEPLKVAAAVSMHPEALQAVLRAVEEERVHRETLFQLECDKLLQELEEKKVKVAFETALARKNLLDVGVSQDEIDRILPV